MKSLEIKDYVRCFDGEIARVINIVGDSVITDMGVYKRSEIEDYNEELNNIVRLGDFVNGTRVYGSKQRPGMFVNGNNVKYMNIVQIQSEKKFYKGNYNVLNPTNTVWAPLYDFPKYEISQEGQVRVIETGKIISMGREGIQPSVRLVRGKERYRKQVARLVLETFIGRADDKIPVFKDGDYNNVSLSNLAWGDTPIKVGKNKETRGRKKKSITQYKYNHVVGYYNGKPVIAGLNSGIVADKLAELMEAKRSTIISKITHSINFETEYKGIQFKMLSEFEYDNIRQDINDDDIVKVFEDIKLNKEKAKKEKERLIAERKRLAEERKIARENNRIKKQQDDDWIYSDDIDSEPSDDYILMYEEQLKNKQEEIKRDRFKQRLLKAMEENK